MNLAAATVRKHRALVHFAGALTSGTCSEAGHGSRVARVPTLRSGGSMNPCLEVIAAAVIASASSSAHVDDDAVVRAPVGSTFVHGESLQPFENCWRMQVTKKDGTTNRDAGLWKDRFEVIDIDGRAYGVRIQDATFRNATGEVAATTRTINIFDRRTMAPVTRSYERHVAGKGDSSVH